MGSAGVETSPTWIAAGIALIGSVAGGIVAYVRSITRADVQIEAIRTDLAAMKAERAEQYDDIKGSIDMMGRQVGETVAAIREKVHITAIELEKAGNWNRDNFVRVPDFIQLRTSIEVGMARIDDKLDRMRQGLEEKIDGIRR